MNLFFKNSICVDFLFMIYFKVFFNCILVGDYLDVLENCNVFFVKICQGLEQLIIKIWDGFFQEQEIEQIFIDEYGSGIGR